MKNICFLIGNMSHSGGTERVTALVANALSKKGYQISILSLADGQQPFFPLEKEIQLYSLYPQKISMKMNFLGAVWKIRKFVKNHTVDTFIIVDSICCMFTVPALFGLSNVKHICWEHFNFNSNLGTRLRDIGRQWAAKYCDDIITLTERDKQLWKNGLKDIRANIIVITNPNPYDHIEHTPKFEHKIVLAVGRLTEQKGFDLLIDAWRLVCQNQKNWQLYIVGSGEDEQLLKQKAIQYQLIDTIKFIPATQNIQQYYEQATLYCMSSRYEGLGMVLIEAESFGLPLISFDCEVGPREIIEHGKNGLLVPALDIESLAKALLTMTSLSKDEYTVFSNHAKEYSKNFALEYILPKWEVVI